MSVLLNQYPNPIIILGLHRSFTSILAQCFEDAGISMYSQNTNKTIHNEDLELLNLNIEYMKNLAFSVDEVIDYEDYLTVATSPTTDKFFENLRAYKEKRELLNSGIYGFKAPRIASLIYYYTKIFPSAKYICCVRNPIKSSRSWIKRGNVKSIGKGIESFSKQLANVAEFFNDWPEYSIYYFNCDGDLKEEEQNLRDYTGVQNLSLGKIRQ